MVGKRITEPGFSDCPAPGRTFRVTMAVIGGIALIQLLALAIGVMRAGRPPVPVATLAAQAPMVRSSIADGALPVTREAPAPAAPVATQGSLPPSAAPMTAPALPAPTSPLLADTPVNDPVTPAPEVAEIAAASAGETSRGPGFVGPAGSGPAPAVVGEAGATAPGDLFEALAAAGRSQPLSDGILERLMVTGAELRESGNMQGALQAFREVENALPDHPRILSEIGATLGKMGLEDKVSHISTGGGASLKFLEGMKFKSLEILDNK